MPSVFFRFFSGLCTFFSASTHRWSALKDNLGTKELVVKSLSDTRWSARADAVKALCAGYDCIKSPLYYIAADDQRNGSARREADCFGSFDGHT